MEANPVRLKSVGDEKCFRCGADLEIDTRSKTDEITFFDCRPCRRSYARALGQGLTDRWLSPISLALYPVIFSSNPANEAERLAAGHARGRSRKQLQVLLDDIREELAHPRQRVRDILGIAASEENAREYLRRFADVIARELESKP